MTSIVYLGPPGTFTHQASHYWDQPGATLVPAASVPEVYREVGTGACDFGVVPIENSVEGYVVPSLDALLAAENVVAVDERSVDITFTAFARSPADAAEATVVASHPYALAECKDYVSRHGFATRTTASTAAACQDIGSNEVVIAAPVCEKLYRLSVVERKVEDFSGARTRFLLLSRRSEAMLARGTWTDGTPTETMLAVTASDAGPGVLADIMAILAEREVNLTSVVTRPLKGLEGRYVFVLSASASPASLAASGAFAALFGLGAHLKVLGTFRSQAHEPPLTCHLDLVPGSVSGSSSADDVSRALLSGP